MSFLKEFQIFETGNLWWRQTLFTSTITSWRKCRKASKHFSRNSRNIKKKPFKKKFKRQKRKNYNVTTTMFFPNDVHICRRLIINISWIWSRNWSVIILHLTPGKKPQKTSTKTEKKSNKKLHNGERKLRKTPTKASKKCRKKN